MMLKKLDLTGFKIGRLIVIGESGRNNHEQILWECKCVCGNTTKLVATVINKGKTLSCGCLQKEVTSLRSLIHGHYGSPEYISYRCMLTRCFNKADPNYSKYGAVGISVCDRWVESFDNFLTDMGLRPQGCSLDRFPLKDGNYGPENCRWATLNQQSQNRKTTRLNLQIVSEIRASSIPTMHLATKYNVSRSTIKSVKNYETWKS